MGILEKIQQIELELSRTQKNKATEYHIGLLKGKLARYRRELLEPSGAGSGSSSKQQGFEVQRSGDARVSLIGYPSVGKSSFLSKVTKTKSEIAHYAFTTLTSVPGVLEYNGAEIQIVDLPGIIKGASEGKGRGRQVIATAKTSDLILMILDATKSYEQKSYLEKELNAIGIRLNKERPNIYFKIKKTGGIKFSFINPPKYLNEKNVYGILRDYRIHNADILVRDENVSIDEFIDTINDQHVRYIKCLYVYNKIDGISLEELDKLANEPNTVVMSCELDLGIKDVVEEIWERLNLIKVYTFKKGESLPNFEDPMVLRKDSSIKEVCDAIHKDLKHSFKHAYVWGTSAKHSPQRCGLSHQIEDEDVITIVSK
ncbi:P-loop containing nucleoside triphosphate hydrolase protein [Ascoidea rubescens DSM 1968]|uniref:p-loop containing nucleoside triphosphate hydrolase protein n=1 Tax=Ascoidea rubescens DSM 1968 TaxID=1344418 RepID=A0A1D2VDQ0_9ASCO|nr:P-loop containing nucleoside triphosphate hydrolase protein [Ascoidea rubescens DSM 1968]ODV59712.1 P-loop containing nucleoside triphosphate hydrolase protein [Ascoidea rubescens DSM 1968]